MVFKKFKNQVSRPTGFLGKLMIRKMNAHHAQLSNWGLSHLNRVSPREMLEIGCGGGRNAGQLISLFTTAHITAIDYSPTSVKEARRHNREAIRAGRCSVCEGDVSRLKFPDGSFDFASAFETIYFWPGLTECFKEVARVLKSGGFFMIVNESDGEDEDSLEARKIIRGMNCYTPLEIEEALKAAGFAKVKTHHHSSKPWITVLARKG